MYVLLSLHLAHEWARLAIFSPPNLWLGSGPKDIVPMLVNGATILTN